MRRKQKKSEQLRQEVNDNRIRMMADRLAILLTICNARHEDDWNPWMGEGMYEDDGALGDQIRNMKDYSVAKDIVRLWVKKQDRRTQEAL